MPIMRLSLVILLVTSLFLLAGCVTLPPAKPIADARSIAGKWSGSVATPGREVPGTLTINLDGAYVAEAPALSPPAAKGTLTFSGGKARFTSQTTGRTGTVTLHEGEGNRILRLTSDDGVVDARYTPAK